MLLDSIRNPPPLGGAIPKPLKEIHCNPLWVGEVTADFGQGLPKTNLSGLLGPVPCDLEEFTQHEP